MNFFAGLLSAIAIKLTSSVDDVLWLAPFLTTNVSTKVRLQNAMVYLGVCLIQTLVAMVIAGSGSEAVAWLTRNENDAWSTDKILTVSAGVLLSIYTVKLTYEYIAELQEGADEKDDEHLESESNAETSTSESEESTVASEMELGLTAKDKTLTTIPEEKDTHEGCDQSDHPTPALSNQRHAEESRCLLAETQKRDERQSPAADAKPNGQSADEKRQQTLFVIAFIGSLDDLTLFVPMLVGKGFDWLQLMCGAVVAASTIVMICLFIGLCKPMADFLSNIPLALIVASFSTVLLVKGFTMQ